jgi:AcrR family transcriptional regulator
VSTTTARSTAARGPYAKTAQRRQEIIDAATNVFAARGYHGGSLRDISRELGLSLTSLVHHFPSKSELLIAVLENADHTGGDWTRDRIPQVGVRTTVEELVTSNFSRPELLRLLAILSSEASHPDHPAHDWFVRRYQRLAEELATEIANDQSLGRVDTDRDPLETAKIILAAWDGLQLQWLLNPNEDMSAHISALLSRLLDKD